MNNVTPPPARRRQTATASNGWQFIQWSDGVTDNPRTVVVGAGVQGETVIEKGVAPGDTVVTDGQLLLAPGSKVEIKKGSG